MHFTSMTLDKMIAAIFLAYLAATAPALAGNTGTLSGTVRDAETGTPLTHEPVYAVSPEQRLSTETDAHGHYIFLNVIPGDIVVISVIAVGYYAVCTTGVIGADETLSLNMTALQVRRSLGFVDVHCAGTSGIRPGVTADVYDIF